MAQTKSIPIDRSDVGRQLTPDVVLVEVEARWQNRKSGQFTSPSIPVATLVYRVQGVTVTMTSGSLYTRPAAVHMEIDAPDGVTYELLHALPMQDARRRFRITGRKLMAGTMAKDTPSRLSTPAEWARFAKAYASLVEAGDATPITSLARATGLPRNTVSARIRHARDKGLLTRPGDGLGELTDHARKILDEEDEES